MCNGHNKYQTSLSPESQQQSDINFRVPTDFATFFLQLFNDRFLISMTFYRYSDFAFATFCKKMLENEDFLN